MRRTSELAVYLTDLRMFGTKAVVTMRSPTILIPHILRDTNGKSLARTTIAKLLYLIDLSWLELYGETLTALPYAYHRDGPYCNEIEAALWSLEDDGVVRPHCGAYHGRSWEAIQYRLENYNARRCPLDPVEAKVVHHVVAQFAERPLFDLIDFVCKTPPMVRVEGKKFQYVEMRLESSERRFGSAELLRLIDRREAAKRGNSKSLSEVVSKLK